MDESKRFVMFGCWNKNECIMGSTANPLSRNMTFLQRFIKKNPTEFVIVAGDNYYPEKPDKTKEKTKEKYKEKTKEKDIEKTKEKDKEKTKEKDKEKTKDKDKKKKDKTKKIITRNLHSGFDCLRQLNTEVNVILGNHDLETRKSLGDTILIHEEGKEERNEDIDECYIIKEEIKENTENIKLRTHVHKKLHHTLIIMLDTTLYLPDNHKYAKCYEHMTRNMDVLKANQQNSVKKWIEEANDDENITNIVFVGHHPIVTYKQKEEMVIDVLPDFIDFLQHLKINSKKIYYLCADVHFYQRSTINLKEKTIKQIVVGTGGTTLDPIHSLSQGEMPTEILDTDLQFTHHESIEEHGFLEVKEKDTELDITFHPLPHLSVGGKTTKKRKIKEKLKRHESA